MGIPAGPFFIDDALVFTAITHRSNGTLSDATGDPAYRIYEAETGTAILTGSMSKLDDSNTTGFYSEQITLSAANGFEVGKSYTIYMTATVQGTLGGNTLNFKIVAGTAAAIDANIYSVNNVTVTGDGAGTPWGP